MTTRTVLLATGLECTPIQAISAAAQQPYVFTAYGHRRALYLSASLAFNGQRLEAPTGHYLLGNGYRAYNAVLMRFNSPDNLSPFGRGGVNAYVYCGGDPVNRVDPSGHISGPGLRLPRFLNGPQRVARMVPQPRTKNVAEFQFDGVVSSRESRMYPDAGKSRLASDGFVFQDKGGTRTSIVAHGDEGLVQFNGKLLSGSQLFEEMHQANMLSPQTEKFRLVVCCSADLGGNSLAATFARRAGKPTKGYEGDVFNNGHTIMAYGEGRPSQSAMDAFVRRNYEIVKKVRSPSRLFARDANGDEVTDFGHRSVTFQPG
jgi:RHS repeat-associated protein